MVGLPVSACPGFSLSVYLVVVRWQQQAEWRRTDINFAETPRQRHNYFGRNVHIFGRNVHEIRDVSAHAIITRSGCGTSQFAGSSGPVPYTLRVFNGVKLVFRLSLILRRKIVMITFMHCKAVVRIKVG